MSQPHSERGGRSPEVTHAPAHRDDPLTAPETPNEGVNDARLNAHESMTVSFTDELARTINRSHAQLSVSFVRPRDAEPEAETRSPLIPYDVISPQTREHLRVHKASFEEDDLDEDDITNNAVGIYPKKIDDLRRFRLFFVGLLMFILSSTQGVHSLFGTILMQQQYLYDVRQMTVVYVCGSAFGMFVLPFGVLYDWFGPRIGIVITVAITALGQLLFALMFAGHISHSVKNSCLFYAILSWGCYGIDVTVLPAILTHFPRDRGQPTGFLKTFSGLGSSLLSCLFRGFFNGRFDNLMWFIFAFTLAFGAIGAWYIEDAPYIVNRWSQRKLTPRKVLRNYLIRNRYMSQLIPKRRFTLAAIGMILLNFYLTIQAVVVAFLMDQMTPGKLRGIAIGAILVTALMLVFVIPIGAIDGMSRQDKEVIEIAKKKEEELARRKEVRKAKEAKEREEMLRAINEFNARDHAAESSGPNGHPPTRQPSRNDLLPHGEHEVVLEELESNPSHAHIVDDVAEPAASTGEGSLNGSLRRMSSLHIGASRRRGQRSPSRRVIELHLDDDDDSSENGDKSSRSTSQHGSMRRQGEGGQSTDASRSGDSPARVPLDGNLRVSFARIREKSSQEPVVSGTSSPRLTPSFAYVPRRRLSTTNQAGFVEVSARDPSTYNNPYVESINVCGEVFLTPVYQTTFLQSLTYIDLWLIAYTTMVVWGVGLSLTANWNIQIMSLARWSALDYKYYVLFAAMSGVSTAGGRVFVGIYEQVLMAMREQCHIHIVPTLAYPLASIGLFIAMIFWIALPGDKVLVLVYILGPAFYGISTSFTPYVLGTIYDRHIGTHYGFIFLGSAIGQVLFFYCSWYLTYDNESMPFPIAPGVPLFQRKCIGHRRCMNKAVGIYLALVFSTIFTSWVVHYRYTRLVNHGIKPRRVVKRAVKGLIGLAQGEHAEKPTSLTPTTSPSSDEIANRAGGDATTATQANTTADPVFTGGNGRRESTVAPNEPLYDTETGSTGNQLDAQQTTSDIGNHGASRRGSHMTEPFQ